MAQKYLLVPEPIYRGLTSTETGDPNLDYTKHELDKIKHGRIESSRKNILYNQELRRYLQLRNERENRPARVEITNGLRMLVKKGDELEKDDDDEDDIIIDGDEPKGPPRPPKPPRRKKKGGGGGGGDENGQQPTGTGQEIWHDAETNRDDIFMQNRDEEGHSAATVASQVGITRGTKRRNVDDVPINFTPKRWPLPVPEPAFRESAKRKYFKSQSKPAMSPTIRMGNPTINKEDDEFGNSPPPSPPLELIESLKKQKRKRIKRELEPDVIEIPSASVRAEWKRKRVPFDEEMQPKKKQKGETKNRPIPTPSTNKDREKRQRLQRQWAARKPTAEEAGAEKMPREKAIPGAPRKQTKIDLAFRWAKTRPTQADMGEELINVVTNKARADLKRREPIQVYEEILPKKKVKPDPPPQPLPAIMPPAPPSMRRSNKKPLSSRFKWATRKPTKEEATNIGPKKINWAIRKPSREEAGMFPKMNWATRTPTQRDIGKGGFKE